MKCLKLSYFTMLSFKLQTAGIKRRAHGDVAPGIKKNLQSVFFAGFAF
jgi:hypothetical protein